MFRSAIFAFLFGFSLLFAAPFEVETIREGKGDTIRAGQLIKVHYRGWILDSTFLANKEKLLKEKKSSEIESKALDSLSQEEKTPLENDSLKTEENSTEKNIATDESKTSAKSDSALTQEKVEAPADSTKDYSKEIPTDSTEEDSQEESIEYTYFDNSYERGEPLEFALGTGQVISGWDKGLVGMKVGEIRQLTIPYEMGYGVRGMGPIPPRSDLFFEVELIEAQKPLPPDTLPKDPAKMPWKNFLTGIQIIDEKPGAGEGAKPGTKIRIHSTGWTLSGRKFSSTKDLGKPIESLLGAGKFVPGVEAALENMKPGAIRWMKLSPAMGYGAKAFSMIPPNSTLIFKIEMLEAERDEELAESMDFFPDTSALQFEHGAEGLRFAVVREGDGEMARAGARARVHYTGWLLNGTKFDSSRDRGQPFEFPLGQGRVIRGWDLGVEGMRPGEKRILLIPPGLGYGSRGAGPIPGDASLIFAVEYLGD